MIQHHISPEDLNAAILRIDPRWYDKARAIASTMPPVPTSKQFKSLWSDIKQIWIDLQGSKCMYCEMPVEGAIANDVEHFRPKSKVVNWKVPRTFVREGVATTPPSSTKGDPGYRDLAYQPWNYAASCKECNSVLKKNYFPIAGPRNTAAVDPRTMQSERAFFVFPIGDIDDKPESLIRFAGMHPEPVRPKGTHEHHRALVMIEAFKLNDAVDRKELFRSRARVMKSMFDALQDFHAGATKAIRAEGEEWVKIHVSRRAPHANCMWSFQTVYEQSPDRAKLLLDDARYSLQSGSLRVPQP